MVGSNAMKRKSGCIKRSKGPWVVRRPPGSSSGGGDEKRSLRWPSEAQREANRQREARRRQVTSKIFKGLRQHGNYKLTKMAGRIEILMALCQEAGWIVEEDGTIFKKPQCGLEPFRLPISHDAKINELKEVELSLTLAPPSGYN